MRLLLLFALISTLIPVSFIKSQDPNPQARPSASPTPTPTPLPPATVKIDNYRVAAGRIIGAALTSDRAYDRLSFLTDHIGNRLSGSQSLERAIEWAVSEMKKDGLDNVRSEKRGRAAPG